MQSFLKVVANKQARIVMQHAVFLLLGSGVIILAGGKLIRGIDALQQSIRRIKRLEGFLPICSHCKKVSLEGAERTKQDSWIAIDCYIQDHTDAEFTHGLCPECAHQLYPTVFGSRKK